MKTTSKGKNNLYLFDCFGVVVSDVSTLWMNKYFNADQQDEIRKTVYRKVDCNQISFDDSFEILSARCGITKAQMYAEWESLTYVLPETLALIDKIHAAGGTVALLSNAAQDYIANLFSQFSLYGYFDKMFVSANYGCAKPDRQFYEICLNSFTTKFDNVFFTDDNPKNLQNLKQLGITPILFTSAADLESELKRLGAL